MTVITLTRGGGGAGDEAVPLRQALSMSAATAAADRLIERRREGMSLRKAPAMYWPSGAAFYLQRSDAEARRLCQMRNSGIDCGRQTRSATKAARRANS